MEWIKARIKPMAVEVRQVTEPWEIIEKRGTDTAVRQGYYIVKTADGELRSCSPETFAECYEIGEEGNDL